MKTLRFIWKYLVGAVLCANPLTAIVIVGWTLRAMRRATFKHWHSASSVGTAGMTFAEFAAEDPATAPLVRWPNWFIRQREGHWLGDSLWLNVKRGLGGAFNTWVFTLPGCVLWLFAWYDGWNNSFNKGYEQAAVGPLTGLAGTMLFIAAMMYVPMALAHQAAAGNWRRFYDFRLVWTLVRRHAWACVGLAAMYALLSMPVILLKTAPMFFDRQPNYDAMTDAQVYQQLASYFLMASFIVFPIFVALRLMAAKLYARALAGAIRKGAVAAESISETERHVLDRLDLLAIEEPTKRHVVVATVGWAGSRFGRIAAGAAAFMIWFTFVAQIYVSEFLNYHQAIGWLNQPLVQLPYFRYIPAALLGH
ncbi:MAG: hypothetical protein GC162_11480 [Planctomycetes bacterium]|nr:hypothetical protein [Planctomycetota bacterium]